LPRSECTQKWMQHCCGVIQAKHAAAQQARPSGNLCSKCLQRRRAIVCLCLASGWLVLVNFHCFCVKRHQHGRGCCLCTIAMGICAHVCVYSMCRHTWNAGCRTELMGRKDRSSMPAAAALRFVAPIAAVVPTPTPAPRTPGTCMPAGCGPPRLPWPRCCSWCCCPCCAGSTAPAALRAPTATAGRSSRRLPSPRAIPATRNRARLDALRRAMGRMPARLGSSRSAATPISRPCSTAAAATGRRRVKHELVNCRSPSLARLDHTGLR
jgi:hypothetical protein